MKNSTQIHECHIKSALTELGCTAIESNLNGLIAVRMGNDNQSYPISVELYEEESAQATDPQRFRARVSRQFGLPVVYHHGATVDEALASVQWRLLDRSPVSTSPLMAFAVV
jgi:hypothetical protein